MATIWKIPLAYTISKSIWLPHMWPYAYEKLYGPFPQHIFMWVEIPCIFQKIYGYYWQNFLSIDIAICYIYMALSIYIIVWLNLMRLYVYEKI
jgi:hypothetical protein